MASKAVELLTPCKLSADWNQEERDAVDLGAFKELNVAIEIVCAGSGSTGQIFLQHAAINQDGQYIALTATQTAVTTAGVNYYQVTGFMRWIRAATDSGSFSNDPVAGIRLIAKE